MKMFIKMDQAADPLNPAALSSGMSMRPEPEPTSRQDTEAKQKAAALLIVEKFGNDKGQVDLEAVDESYKSLMGELKTVKGQFDQATVFMNQAKPILQSIKDGTYVRADAKPADNSGMEAIAKELSISTHDFEAALGSFVDSRVAKEVATRVQEQVGPVNELSEAQTSMKQRYGKEYAANEADMFQYMAEQPELAQDFKDMVDAGKTTAAFNMAWKDYKHAKVPAKKDPVVESDQAHAGPTGGKGIRQEGGNQTDKRADLERLAKASDQSGDYDEYFAKLFEGMPLTYDEVVAEELIARRDRS